MTLSAAQQALALEYGCRNWAALRAEVQRPVPAGALVIRRCRRDRDRRGTLLAEGLVVGDDDALLFTTVTPWEASPDDVPGPTAGRGRTTASSRARPRTIDDEIRALGRQPGPMTSRSPMTREQRTPLALRAASGAGGPLSGRLAPGRSDPRAGRLLARAAWQERAAPACCARLARSCGSAGPPVTARRTDDRPTMPPSPGRHADQPTVRHHLDLGVTCRPSTASRSSSTASIRRQSVAGRSDLPRRPAGFATGTDGIQVEPGRDQRRRRPGSLLLRQLRRQRRARRPRVPHPGVQPATRPLRPSLRLTCQRLNRPGLALDVDLRRLARMGQLTA